jgi:aerobic carbon-monoxide dehydrogenase medium subunit
MTLPPFELHRPETVEEATEFAFRYGEDAAFYCGGTELLLLLKLGFASFGHLVDLKRIEELGGVRSENGGLVLGATVTHRELERSELVRERMPSLAAMERQVANLRVREVGTLGGNLCFSDPHSDPATFLLAANAEVECRRGGEVARRQPIGDFVVGPYQTSLGEGDLLTAVHVPALPDGAVVTHAKFAFHERPTATVACLARLADGATAEVRIAVGSVGAKPVRSAAAEALLAGMPADELDPALIREAGEHAAEDAAPVDDATGSADYKAQLVCVLVERTFREAVG